MGQPCTPIFGTSLTHSPSVIDVRYKRTGDGHRAVSGSNSDVCSPTRSGAQAGMLPVKLRLSYSWLNQRVHGDCPACRTDSSQSFCERSRNINEWLAINKCPTTEQKGMNTLQRVHTDRHRRAREYWHTHRHTER